MEPRTRNLPFTEEQVRHIYDTNIIEFAMNNGFEIEKGDRHTVHVKNSGGLYLFKHGKGFYCFTTEKKGNIVDFAMEYLNLSKREAMERILGTCSYGAAPSSVPPQKQKERKPMLLPPHDVSNNRAAAYLVLQRRLDEDIVYDLMEQGLIYQAKEMAGGKARVNCAFVGYGPDGAPGYCSLRGMGPGSSFRKDVDGSRKECGFLIPGRSRRVYEFEAPIDAISHATLCKIHGIDWMKDYRLSEGCLSDRALQAFLKRYPEVKEIVFCYDNDVDGTLPDGTPHNHGQVKAMEMKKKYESLGYRVLIQTPHLKDFNEDLVHLSDERMYLQGVCCQERTEEYGGEERG